MRLFPLTALTQCQFERAQRVVPLGSFFLAVNVIDCRQYLCYNFNIDNSTQKGAIMKFTVILITFTLTGCAGGIARFYDNQDPCQNRPELDRPPNYEIPNWCGASKGRIVIYNNQGRAIGFIR